MTSVMAFDGVTSFNARKTLKTHVKVCETVRRLAGFLQCYGGKMEEAEDFKSVSIVYCVFESK